MHLIKSAENSRGTINFIFSAVNDSDSIFLSGSIELAKYNFPQAHGYQYMYVQFGVAQRSFGITKTCLCNIHRFFLSC